MTDTQGRVDMRLDLVVIVPAGWNLANQNKRRLETIRLKVRLARIHLIETLAARQGDSVGRHHQCTGDVVRTLKQLEHLVGRKQHVRIDAQVRVERLRPRRCETLGPGVLLADHHLVAFLCTAKHQIGPVHQKRGCVRELASLRRNHKAQTHL